MRVRSFAPAAAAVAALATFLPAQASPAPQVAAPSTAAPSTASASTASGAVSADGKATPYKFAVIGDMPYGSTQLAQMPAWISKINAQNPVMTFHVGDIKTSARRCDSYYMTKILTLFNRFNTALIYTPGDNEWADCHQKASGSYNPLERLAKLRSVMYPTPGRTLGKAPLPVSSQSSSGFPENVRLARDGIVYVVVHSVGANDDLEVWTGRNNVTPAQRAEETKRMGSATHTIAAAFQQAKDTGAKAVVIVVHVDMFDPTHTPVPAKLTAYKPLVQTLITQANQFRGQVYLFNGDSHEYNVDNPLQSGSKWLSIYGVNGYSTKLQRITVDGDQNVRSFLLVTANSGATGPVLSWTSVPF